MNRTWSSKECGGRKSFKRHSNEGRCDILGGLLEELKMPGPL
jgi:hypothetical protein